MGGRFEYKRFARIGLADDSHHFIRRSVVLRRSFSEAKIQGHIIDSRRRRMTADERTDVYTYMQLGYAQPRS